MLLKIVSFVVLVLLGSVPLSLRSAQADEHTVIILGSAYFPQHVAVENGDVVRFINASGRDHTVVHTHGKWATYPMANGEELLVTIDTDMTGEFYGMSKHRIVGRFDLLQASLTH